MPTRESPGGYRTLHELPWARWRRHGADSLSADRRNECGLYLATQLKNFRTGARSNPVMMTMVKNLSDDDITAVSAYYAAMPIPAPAQEAQPPAGDTEKTASELAQWGDWSRRTLPACAQCHGENGAGVADAGNNTLFPPLWGAESYNWGAGMHNIDAAAAFIKHNMPLGLRDSLSDQDAWDVAAYMNSHERPQDPRFNGNLQETAKKFHASKFSLYGKHKSAEGFMLGGHPATALESQQKQ